LHGRKLLILTCLCINMKKRIILNTFYTLGIVISVVGLKWAWQNANYPMLALLVSTALFFLYLKINIVKEVKSDLKEKEAQVNAMPKKEID